MALRTPAIRLVALVNLLFALSPFAAAYEGVTEVGPTGKRIVRVVRAANRTAGFSGAVLAAQQGKIIAAVAVGSSGDDPLEVTTLFELASCTKPFTAIAVMKLVEEGRLSLDDSIAKHLPGVPDSCSAITVRHLLQHTSGIPGTNVHGAGTDLAAVLSTFLAGGPKTPPGEQHEYWNQGYSLLSEIIARASGKPYTEYCREAIFAPCKMTSTAFTGDKPPTGAKAAIGQSMTGRDRSAFDHPYGEYGFQYRGMGGIVTNLPDLWRWDRALAQGKLLKPESLAEMTRPGPSDYGLGWNVKKLDAGRTVHEHTGSVRGFLASLRRDGAGDGCLFVLANSDASLPFELTCSWCEQALDGKQASVALPPPVDAKLVDELVGVYRDDQGRTLTVSREGAFTRAWIDWHGPITRGYLNSQKSKNLAFAMIKSFDPFQFEKSNEVAVQRDDSGAVTALTLDLEPPVRFTRAAE